jgi:hypothetical protein
MALSADVQSALLDTVCTADEPADPEGVLTSMNSAEIVSFSDHSPSGRAHCEALRWVGLLYVDEASPEHLPDFKEWMSGWPNRQAFLRAASRFLDRRAAAEGKLTTSEATAGGPDWIAQSIASPGMADERDAAGAHRKGAAIAEGA